MNKQRRIRFNPNSIYSSQTKEELSLVGLSPHIEDVESGEGLHLQSPEAYFCWLEDQEELAIAAYEELDIYWDES
jgi:hypothetical protein